MKTTIKKQYIAPKARIHVLRPQKLLLVSDPNPDVKNREVTEDSDIGW